MTTFETSDTTLHHKRSSAQLCRDRGWGPGTRLIGDEGYGPTVIEITAVGEERLLAKCLGHAGGAHAPHESAWVLFCRDWREAADDEIPVPFQSGERVVADSGLQGVVVSGPDTGGCYRIAADDGSRWIVKNPDRVGGSHDG